MTMEMTQAIPSTRFAVPAPKSPSIKRGDTHVDTHEETMDFTTAVPSLKHPPAVDTNETTMDFTSAVPSINFGEVRQDRAKPNEVDTSEQTMDMTAAVPSLKSQQTNANAGELGLVNTSEQTMDITCALPSLQKQPAPAEDDASQAELSVEITGAMQHGVENFLNESIDSSHTIMHNDQKSPTRDSAPATDGYTSGLTENLKDAKLEAIVSGEGPAERTCELPGVGGNEISDRTRDMHSLFQNMLQGGEDSDDDDEEDMEDYTNVEVELSKVPASPSQPQSAEVAEQPQSPSIAPLVAEKAQTPSFTPAATPVKPAALGVASMQQRAKMMQSPCLPGSTEDVSKLTDSPLVPALGGGQQASDVRSPTMSGFGGEKAAELKVEAPVAQPTREACASKSAPSEEAAEKAAEPAEPEEAMPIQNFYDKMKVSFKQPERKRMSSFVGRAAVWPPTDLLDQLNAVFIAGANLERKRSFCEQMEEQLSTYQGNLVEMRDFVVQNPFWALRAAVGLRDARAQQLKETINQLAKNALMQAKIDWNKFSQHEREDARKQWMKGSLFNEDRKTIAALTSIFEKAVKILPEYSEGSGNIKSLRAHVGEQRDYIAQSVGEIEAMREELQSFGREEEKLQAAVGEQSAVMDRAARKREQCSQRAEVQGKMGMLAGVYPAVSGWALREVREEKGGHNTVEIGVGASFTLSIKYSGSPEVLKSVALKRVAGAGGKFRECVVGMMYGAVEAALAKDLERIRSMNNEFPEFYRIGDLVEACASYAECIEAIADELEHIHSGLWQNTEVEPCEGALLRVTTMVTNESKNAQVELRMDLSLNYHHKPLRVGGTVIAEGRNHAKHGLRVQEDIQELAKSVSGRYKMTQLCEMVRDRLSL